MPQRTVYYDSASGMFRPNRSWSPAHTGLNRAAQRRLVDQLFSAAGEVKFSNNVRDMARLGYGDFGEGGAGYMSPDSGDSQFDRKKAEADAISFEMERQGKTLEQMYEDQNKPKGFDAVLDKTLNNRGGRGLMRVLDVISRPLYANMEALDSGIRAARNETSEHPGWEALPPTYRYGKDAWRNSETGKVETKPEWGTGTNANGESKVSGPGWQEVMGEGLKGGWRGLQGKDKTTFGNVLRGNDLLEGKPAAVVGLGGDILFDPATYVSFGTANFVKKGGMEALERGEREAVEAAARTTARDSLGEIAASGGRKGAAAEKALLDEGSKTWQKTLQKSLQDELETRGLARQKVRIPDIEATGGKYNPKAVAKRRLTEALDGNEILKARQAARGPARAEIEGTLKASGLPVDKSLVDDFVKRAEDQAANSVQKQISEEIADEVATLEAMKLDKQLEVKFLGKPIATSEKAGKALAQSGDFYRNTRLGSFLARSFRTDAEVGTALHTMSRRAKGLNMRRFEEESELVRSTFKKLGVSHKGREAIARAVELGDTKGLTQAQVEGYNFIKKLNKRIFDDEVGAGLRAATDFNENYMYHFYRSKDIPKGIGASVDATTGKVRFPTIQAAQEAGAKPLTDAADIMAFRLSKHYQQMSSHALVQDIIDKFGIDLAAAPGKHAGVTRSGLRGIDNIVEAQKIKGLGNFKTLFPPNVFLDKDTAVAVSKLNEVLGSERSIQEFLGFYDKTLARLKFLQTAPNPGFHIRNTMSDLFVNFLDGVVNPHRYVQAERLIMADQRLGSAVLPGVLGNGEVKMVLKNGNVIKGREIIEAYDGQGLRSGFYHADAGMVEEGLNRISRGSRNVIRGFSEKREDIMRMAHFIDAAQKAGEKGMRAEEIYELAAKRVKKFNFDYQDLTKLEQKVFRRVVPFYSFMRKNVPLMLENFFTNPGKMIVPTKANNALASFMGQDNKDEPLPGLLNMTPKWLRDVPGAEVQSGAPGSAQSPVMMNVDMPHNQLGQLFGGFADGDGTVPGAVQSGTQGLLKELLVGQSSPIIRGGVELATQRDLGTGADKPAGFGDTLLGTFPVGNMVLDYTGLANVVGSDKLFVRGEPKDGPTYTVNVAGNKVTISETLANYVTGLGFRKVTPERMQSELRRRQDVIENLMREAKKAQIKKAREEWEAKLSPEYKERNPDWDEEN